jgi:hypothetical protein
MLFLLHLSFLLSAGQAIRIPRYSLHDDLGQDQSDGPVLAQIPTALGAIPRGFRTPLPFDEDVFDPTHVVSNPS